MESHSLLHDRPRRDLWLNSQLVVLTMTLSAPLPLKASLVAF